MLFLIVRFFVVKDKAHNFELLGIRQTQKSDIEQLRTEMNGKFLTKEEGEKILSIIEKVELRLNEHSTDLALWKKTLESMDKNLELRFSVIEKSFERIEATMKHNANNMQQAANNSSSLHLKILDKLDELEKRYNR